MAKMVEGDMKREERIEAGISAAQGRGYGLVDIADVKAILKAAFPEYFANTHVLLPREPTEEMLDQSFDAADFYRLMLQAYEQSND